MWKNTKNASLCWGRAFWTGGGVGVTLIQTKQKRAAREQRNKYKPRTETSTNQEQKQEQHLPIRHAGRPAADQEPFSFLTSTGIVMFLPWIDLPKGCSLVVSHSYCRCVQDLPENFHPLPTSFLTPKVKTHREVHSWWGVFTATHRVWFLHLLSLRLESTVGWGILWDPAGPCGTWKNVPDTLDTMDT